ncbi:hypothetical protein JHY03_37000 [Streptomyces sp. CA-256286]|nr:hypothetical protein JHY03_37000 [Streptomyces sp. CA-256286]
MLRGAPRGVTCCVLRGVTCCVPRGVGLWGGGCLRGFGERGRRGLCGGSHLLGLVRAVLAVLFVGSVGSVGCPVQAVLAALFPYQPPAGQDSEDEHRQDTQHHQLADEQAPEQPVAGELGRGSVRPGAGEVLRGGGQFAQGERGLGERDAVRPGPVREEAGQSGGRPGEQGGREQEAEQPDQQAVGDAAAARVLVPGAVPVAPLGYGSVGCPACHVRPPSTGTTRSSAAGSPSGPPVVPLPAPRRGCPRGAGRPTSPRSWRGR